MWQEWCCRRPYVRQHMPVLSIHQAMLPNLLRPGRLRWCAGCELPPTSTREVIGNVEYKKRGNIMRDRSCAFDATATDAGTCMVRAGWKVVFQVRERPPTRDQSVAASGVARR